MENTSDYSYHLTTIPAGCEKFGSALVPPFTYLRRPVDTSDGKCCQRVSEDVCWMQCKYFEREKIWKHVIQIHIKVNMLEE